MRCWGPTPRPIGGPLEAPSADNTEALLCLGGGSPGKKGNQTKKENNKPRKGDCSSGSKQPPAPWAAQRASPAHLPISDFPLPLPNILTAGQEAPEEKLGLSVSHLVPGSL